MAAKKKTKTTTTTTNTPALLRDMRRVADAAAKSADDAAALAHDLRNTIDELLAELGDEG